MIAPSAIEIADAIRNGRTTAQNVVTEALANASAGDGRIGAITRLLPDRALREAASIDAKVAAGIDPGPLAGVPYLVKDLFDVAGLPTTAGANMRADAAPASSDALAIRRLRDAGAVLIGTTNMDEYAYGFVTDNARWGITRNPYDEARFSGGSSGGAAAAVAAGLASFSLGSDTNGSIRVPASLCGLFGLKPTHGDLPMDGVFPFVESLDDIGPFARSSRELALISAIMADDQSWLDYAPSPSRSAFLTGWFAANLSPAMQGALASLADALGHPPSFDLPDVDRARSAAFLITAREGGLLHLPALRENAMAFDPATRDRLMAGAMLPSQAYDEAQAFREEFRQSVLKLFDDVDVLIAPATFGPAPLIDEPFIPLNGRKAPARANLGLYTQPISLIGLPVVSAPLHLPGHLPMGIQLIGPPESEARLFSFAQWLETQGLVGFTAPRAHPRS